jgi:SAM-dependent methyltransferase
MDRLLAATRVVERDRFWFRGFRRFVTPLLAAAVAGRSVPRLLDCGCGTGWNLEWLRQYGTAFGFDLTWSGSTAARSAGQCRIAQATAAALPFTSGCVDVATSFDVLYLLPDDAERAALAEMYRVAVPGGVAIVKLAVMLCPVMLAARGAQRLSGARAEESDIRMPPAPVNAVLSGALAVEAAILRWLPMPVGSSLIAVARKRTTDY